MKKSDFDIHFDNAFATLNQTRFEDWFARMASRVYGTDFELIKAGGKSGDKKVMAGEYQLKRFLNATRQNPPRHLPKKQRAKSPIAFQKF